MQLTKRLISLSLALSLLLTSLWGCGGDSSSGDDSNDDSTDLPNEGGAEDDLPDAEGYVYRKGVTVRIITSADGSNADVSAIFKSVMTLTGKAPKHETDDSESGQHEIIIGDSKRTATNRAKRHINSKNLEENVGAYCIYAFDGSVAIYATDDTVLEE